MKKGGLLFANTNVLHLNNQQIFRRVWMDGDEGGERREGIILIYKIFGI